MGFGIRCCYLLILVLACPSVAIAQIYDGQWQVSESVNATACGEGTYTESYAVTVLQTGNQLSVTANGIIRAGTLSGNTLTFSASYSEDGGTTSSTGKLVFNGSSASGSSSWSWTNGSITCGGTSAISANRVSEPLPSPDPIPAETPALPAAPAMSFETSGNTLVVTWTAVAEATGYLFYYAPYPSADPVATMDLGSALTISGDLPTGSTYYMAIQSYNAAGQGGTSSVGNFLVKGVDVIEVANSDSDIIAIVYGSENASAIIFNDGSNKTTRFKFADSRSATLVSDGQGNFMQFDIAGYNFSFVHSGDQVRTTLTEPNGNQTSVVQSSMLSEIQTQPDYTSGCTTGDFCVDAQAASADPDAAEALDRAIETEGGVMRRVATIVGGCPWWMPASACLGLDGYLIQSENLIDRLSDRVNTKVQRISTKFKCLVDFSDCADVVAAQAPAIVAELTQFDSEPRPPTAAFNVGEGSLKPDPDGWASYLAESGFVMKDVPCSESVFASIRPECGATELNPDVTDNPNIGAGNDGDNPAPTEPADSGNSSTGEAPTESISTCVTVDPSAIESEAGCYNSQGSRTGEWKFYLKPAGKLQYIWEVIVYSNNAATQARTRYKFNDTGGYYKYLDEVLVNNQRDGDYREYFGDGSPKIQAHYSAGVINGAYKYWYAPGALGITGNYLEGNKDGYWEYYRFPSGSTPGTISESGSYAAGKQIGVWTYYSVDGSEVTTVSW